MVERTFPERNPSHFTRRENEMALVDLIPEGFAEHSRPVTCESSGYLQAIDYEGLLDLAVKHDLVLRTRHHVGHFLVPDSDLVDVFPGKNVNDRELCKQINGHFITGWQRSQNQDLELLINELVEIAARALSPGINDPFTAISCIDHLTLALCDLAQRAFPSPGHLDQDNKLRIINTPPSFRSIVDLAFDQIRQYGHSHTAITLHLLEGIIRILPFTRNTEQRDALLRQAAIIEHSSRTGLPVKEDCEKVHAKYLEIFEILRDMLGLTGEIR